MTTVKGIALAPGVSRNGRLYTREAIAKAFARLSERVNAGDLPVVMRTHHDAGDDSTRVVGRVRKVSLTSDGAIAYESDLADTSAGRDIAELAKGNTRALAHVSIYGSWVGAPHKIQHEGRMVETADDLEIDKIDFTATPGVLGATAQVEHFEPSTDPTVLAESMRPVMFADEVDEANKAPYGDVAYADPGYQADKKKRYPIDSAEHVRAAWSYINKSGNGGEYTSSQLASIKSRIKAAAKKFDVQISSGESYDATEVMSAVSSEPSSCMSLSACVGGFDLSICAWGIDPADLDAYTDCAQEAIQAACAVLSAGPHDADADASTETTQTPAANQVTETQKEAAMADEITQGEQVAEAAAPQTTETVPGFDYDRLAEAIAKAMKPAEASAPAEEATAAPEAPVTETAPVTVAEVKAQVIADLVKEGVIKPARKGAGLSETTSAVDPAQAWDKRGEEFAAALLGVDLTK